MMYLSTRGKSPALGLSDAIAAGLAPGYDVRPAERTILQAINVPELAKPAIEAASRLPGSEPQMALATAVLDAQKPADVRALAAENLVRHAQRHGTALNAQSIQALMDLLPTIQDPVLRARVAAAVGTLQGNGRQSGMRLQRYSPPLPQPAAPPAAPPPAAPPRRAAA